MSPPHKLLFYIAGPYRGNVRANIRRAEAYAAECAEREMYYFCPHMNSAFIDHEAPEEFWLALDLAFLAHCDVLLLLPGWETSAGTLGEREFAESVGMAVYEIDEYFRIFDEGKACPTT